MATLQQRPRAPVDVALNLALLVVVLVLAEVLPRLIGGGVETARANAEAIVDIERSLGIFVEPSLQVTNATVEWVANALYVGLHVPVLAAALTVAYVRSRDEVFVWARAVFLVAMVLTVALYTAIPTAPPRFFSGLGLEDSLSELSGGASGSEPINQFAAMPSGHVVFACVAALCAARLVRRPAARVACAAYPLLTTAIVLVTANHWVLDIVAGFAVAGAAAAIVTYRPTRRAVPRR